MRRREFPPRELPEQASQPSIFKPGEIEDASLEAQRKRSASLARDVAAIIGKKAAKVEKNKDAIPSKLPQTARIMTEEEKKAREIGAPEVKKAIAAVESGLSKLENKSR